jgi:hypothetical protein
MSPIFEYDTRADGPLTGARDRSPGNRLPVAVLVPVRAGGAE